MTQTQMTPEATATDVANHYWAMTPAEFDAWLDRQCSPVGEAPNYYNLIRTAYQGDLLAEDWFSDHATER